MYTEFEKHQFVLVHPLIRGVSTYLSLSAIVEGKSRGRIWGNDAFNPDTALVWDVANGFVFVLAASKSGIATSEMRHFFRDELGPMAKAAGYAKLYTLLLFKATQTEISELFMDLSVDTLDLYDFALQRETEIRLHDVDVPWDSRLKRIGRSVLDLHGLTNIGEVRRCIKACWQSLDNYLSEGIGFVIFKDGDVASWCSTDYIVSDKCDLYAETFDGYKQKGFGTIVTLACVKECFNQNLEIHWHCWPENLSSIRLAKKVGFLQRPSQPVQIVTL